MKNSRIVPAIAAAMLAAAAFPAAAQQAAAAANSYKIGYVDTERVMRSSRGSQQVLKDLDAEFQRRSKEIEAGPPGDVERRKIALGDEMNMKKEFAVKQFVDRANDTLRRIAEAEKFDAVFLEAAYASARIDLTDRLINTLDAQR
jgi:outer membrane protein